MVRRTFWALAAAGLLAALAPAHAQQGVFKASQTGNPGIKGIDAISFAPGGVLLVGDGSGSQVVVIDTGDTTPVTWTKTEYPGIAKALAGRIGAMAGDIEILKMAVNPDSRKVYIAVRKKADKSDLILTLDGQGEISDFDLDDVKYSRVILPEDNGAQVKLITDIAFTDGRIMVAAQANDQFASKFISIPLPLREKASGEVVSTETYHVAHGRWETKAPIRTIIPYEEDGKKFVVGAFTCTPVVKYPVEDLKAEGKVKGESVIELGNGNTPRDMFAYEKDGKKYILMNTFRMFHSRAPIGPSPYWTVKIDYSLLRESENVNEKALRRLKGNNPAQSATDRAVVIPEYSGVMHLDKLDAQRAAVIRTDDKGGTDFAVLELP